MLDYREMTQADREGCALLAAEAFYDYEYFSKYIPNERRRRSFVDALITCEFQSNWGKPGVVFLTAWENGRIVAVAQLYAPGSQRPSDADYIRCGFPRALLKGGIGPVGAWLAMEKKAIAPCLSLTGKNWYMNLLTVAKSEEGKGVGSRFLRECLIPHAKNAGGKVFSLFTNSEINRRFYEANGFTLFDERSFAYKGRTIGSWSYSMEL